MSSAEPGVPDRMKVTRDGHLFYTGSGGIWVIDPQGQRVGGDSRAGGAAKPGVWWPGRAHAVYYGRGISLWLPDEGCWDRSFLGALARCSSVPIGGPLGREQNRMKIYAARELFVRS